MDLQRIPGDSSVPNPIQNGLLANCCDSEDMFVRVQVSVDYSYAIHDFTPLLPQTSKNLTNRAGQAYTLVTNADVAQSATSILDLTYQTSPSQIVPVVFGSTANTLNQNAKMAHIEVKILRVTQRLIIQIVFLTIAPNYTNQTLSKECRIE